MAPMSSSPSAPARACSSPHGDDRETWEVTGPQSPDGGGVGHRHRHARRPLPAAGRDDEHALGANRGALRRPRRHVERAGAGIGAVPRVDGRRARPGVAAAPRPGDPARRGLGRHRAGRAVPLRRRRGELHPRRGPVGPSAPARSGSRAAAGQCLHTVRAPPRRPATAWSSPSRRPACTAPRTAARRWAASNTGIGVPFLPEGEQHPEFGQCVHKVAGHPDRPEQLFLQNHGGVYRSDDGGASWSEHRRRAAVRLRLPDGVPSAPPRRGVRRAARRRRPSQPARATGSGCGGPTTPASRGASCRPVCPTSRCTARCCVTRWASTTPTRPGCTSAPAPARCSPAATRASRGRPWSATCPTCSRCGPPSSA